MYSGPVYNAGDSIPDIDSGWEVHYENFGPFKGPQGSTGPQGATGPAGDADLLFAKLSVGTTGPAVLGGKLTYDSTSGEFTYTPTISNDWTDIPALKDAT